VTLHLNTANLNAVNSYYATERQTGASV